MANIHGNQREPVRPLIYSSRAVGLLHLGSYLAGEVVDVVERMHGTIERAPLPWAKLENDRTWGITGLVYRAIRNSFATVTGSAGRIALQMDRLAVTAGGQALDDDGWLPVRAAMNGVFGDALAAQGSPLAVPMSLVREGGVTHSRTRVLFAHGLCMSERGWLRGDFEAFEAWCGQALDASTVHLRYNSGRHISENGRDLARLLQQMVQDESIEQLILIGHSMGGLLYRSACHQARQLGHNWPDRVTHIAMLGSPHHGAPLERVGQFANGLLKLPAYTRPLSHLGDLRSVGIKDLRFGNLLEQDWFGIEQSEHHPDRREPVPLLQSARHLTVAATRSVHPPEPVWSGKDDWLVPVASALGLSRRQSKALDHTQLRREVVHNLDHLNLMGDSRVMALLKDWLTQ